MLFYKLTISKIYTKYRYQTQNFQQVIENDFFY
jgi:hypothetical protein